MVQWTVKAILDASSIHDRADLADSLSSDSGDVRLRIRAVFTAENSARCRSAIRCQPHLKRDLYTDSIWPAESAAGSSGHFDRLEFDYLDDDCCLALLSMGCGRSTSVLCLGVTCNDSTAVNYVDELVKSKADT